MRFLLVLLATLAISTSAIAQSRFRALRPGLQRDRYEPPHRHATSRWGAQSPRSGATFFGFSFGTLPYGYDYAGYPDPYFLYPYSLDPWAHGSFRQPDLLDDPYFYDRVPSANRYQRPLASRRFSHSNRRPSLELRNQSNKLSAPSLGGQINHDGPRSAGPAVVQSDVRPYSAQRSVAESQPGPVDRDSTTGIESLELLQQANEELLLSLARYDGGEAWIEFLGCERMIAHAVESNMEQLRLLMARYDGVANDPAMRAVASIDGFDRTRAALRRYLRQPIESFEFVDPSPAVEVLPAPQPEARREALLEGATEV